MLFLYILDSPIIYLISHLLLKIIVYGSSQLKIFLSGIIKSSKLKLFSSLDIYNSLSILRDKRFQLRFFIFLLNFFEIFLRFPKEIFFENSFVSSEFFAYLCFHDFRVCIYISYISSKFMFI